MDKKSNETLSVPGQLSGETRNFSPHLTSPASQRADTGRAAPRGSLRLIQCSPPRSSTRGEGIAGKDLSPFTDRLLVSIVVVTFGVKDYLGHCLDSLKAQSYQEIEIIVIDNSQKQDINQLINRHYSGLQIYASPRNLFYPGALNQGIEVSKGAFVLCLNDDVVLDRDFIKEALRGFGWDERIGMVSGKILRPDRKTIDSTGLFLSIERTARERGYGAYDRGQFDKEGYVFGVNGAVGFYRKEMLEEFKIGSEYFDADYRMFYEDLDIAWRAHNFGWRGYYLPCAIAYHLRGGTARVKKGGVGVPFARRYLGDSLHIDLIKNRYLTIIKNESITGFLLHFPFIIFYDFIQWGYILLCQPRLVWLFRKNSKYLVTAFRKRKKIKNT